MGCAICGRADEGFKIYALSLTALQKFFKLMGDNRKILLCDNEAPGDQTLHVCVECLKFGRY